MDNDAIRNEIVQCGRDPLYFLKKYGRIQHPVRGIIPFALFDYQEQLITDYQNHRFNVILKARQLGISEATAGYAAWMMNFHRNKNILVMATKAETAKNIIKKVKLLLAKLPPWLRLSQMLVDNRMSVELSNGSQIKAIASSDDAGRSEAVSLLIVDEAAHVPNLEELWTGLVPTVSTGGKIIVLSTPNGVGNMFHKLYVDAMEGRNEFHATKLMWWVHPERVADLVDDPDRQGFKLSTWYKEEIKKTNMSPRQVAQELECNFNASGETVISAEDIEWVHQGTIDPQKREHWDRNLWIWWEPEKQKRYFITADVARGDGKDNSSFDVWDTEDMEQAAEYYGKLPVEEFARLLVDVGHRYNNAILAVENNNIGMACLEHIRLLGYENVYYSRRGDGKVGEAIHSSWGPTSDDMVIGFTMSPKVRPLVIAKLEEYIRNKTIGLRSRRLHHELKTFVWENGKPQAMKGYNDDAIISVALGCWLKDTFISPGEAAAKLDQVLLENMRVTGHVNTEIKGATKNPEFVNQRTMGVFTTQNKIPTKIRLPGPGNRSEDFSWLYK